LTQNNVYIALFNCVLGEELSWKHLSEGIFPTASVNTLQSDLSKVCTRDTAMEQAALDIGVSPLDEVTVILVTVIFVTIVIVTVMLVTVILSLL
jgi:hypothetical protein